jgi:hypothetical protein
VLEEFLHVLRELGIVAWLEDVRGQGPQRALGPLVQDCRARWRENAVGD